VSDQQVYGSFIKKGSVFIQGFTSYKIENLEQARREHEHWKHCFDTCPVDKDKLKAIYEILVKSSGKVVNFFETNEQKSLLDFG